MRKSLLLVGALALCSSSVMAGGFAYPHMKRHHGNNWYVGINTGASFVTNQSFDHYKGLEDYWYDHRDESSARGYNGGLLVGYNFYCHCNMTLGIELSGNIYSNRGRYTILAYEGGIEDTAPTYHNFEFSHDMEYSWHLTLRPSFAISPCSSFYLNAGLGYAKVNFKAENKIPANAAPYPARYSGDDSEYGFTIGAGLAQQITCHLGVFAEYQYTYYGDFCLDDVVQGGNIEQPDPPAPPMPAGTYKNRSATIDTNVFKIGLSYCF